MCARLLHWVTVCLSSLHVPVGLSAISALISLAHVNLRITMSLIKQQRFLMLYMEPFTNRKKRRAMAQAIKQTSGTEKISGIGQLRQFSQKQPWTVRIVFYILLVVI